MREGAGLRSSRRHRSVIVDAYLKGWGVEALEEKQCSKKTQSSGCGNKKAVSGLEFRVEALDFGVQG